MQIPNIVYLVEEVVKHGIYGEETVHGAEKIESIYIFL